MIDVLGMKPKNYYLGDLIEEKIKTIKDVEGYYYRGFPVVSLTDGGVTLDGILCSDRHGLIVFHFTDERYISADFIDTIDEIHMKFISRLSEVKALTKNRILNVPLNSIVFCPNCTNLEEIDCEDGLFVSNDINEIAHSIDEVKWQEGDLLKVLLSNVQSLSKLQPRKKRQYVKKEDSKGNVLKKLENSLATLDSSQTTAVLVNIDGVQRIRGLAGSGKTIVLARKVAHIHSQHPEWKIAVTFNSRSLKEQLKRVMVPTY